MNSSDTSAATNGSRVKSVLLVVAVLAVGLGTAWWIMDSAPTPKKMEGQQQARLVEVLDLEAQSSRPVWRAGGKVMAAQQLQLTPRVSGRIVELAGDALPGARLEQGALLARMDPQDFRLKLAQRQAAVIQAQADLDIEKGQASLAEEEYQLAATPLSEQDRALVLRKPQIARAQAALKNARANARQAQLDLERSELRMPFSGQITTRSVSVGSQVGINTSAFELVNTEQFWIEVKIPLVFLNWLDKSAPVMLSQSGWAGKTREARILNVLPAVDSADRQVKLILALDDPLGLNNSELPAVLLNGFVECELPGKVIDNAYRLESRFIDDDNQTWVVNNGELQRRQLNVLYHGREHSWVAREGVTGFVTGDQLLLSRLDAPVVGAAVRKPGDEARLAKDVSQ